ncbi:UNVERIFIED_CONTAM: hypothetical protein FKN15_003408 [Acipenser sinensis]
MPVHVPDTGCGFSPAAFPSLPELHGGDGLQTTVAVASEGPNADKTVLLDAPISPGHTFGPALEEILQRSHRECKVSRQVAALLPPCAPVLGRSNCWQAPPARTITTIVPVPMALLGDLSHHLQATAAVSNQPLPQGKGKAGRGESTEQR